MAALSGYTPTRDQLHAIAEHAGIGPLATWRRLTGGVVNPVMALNERAVLRINIRDKDDPKVAKEAWVLGFMSQHPPPEGWVAPRVIAADTSRTILPYDYLLLELLPGVAASSLWRNCDLSQRVALSRQLGRALAHIHSLPLPGSAYGSWNSASGSLGAYDDWHRLIRERNSWLLSEAHKLSALDRPRLTAVTEWLEEHFAAIPAHPERVLIHGDLGLWNALAAAPINGAQPTITAILDFEWAQAGPPALDFAPLLYDPTDEIDSLAFLDAYSAIYPLTAPFLREVVYYQMQYQIDLLGVVQRHWGGVGAAPFLRTVDLLLASQMPPGYAAAGLLWPF